MSDASFVDRLIDTFEQIESTFEIPVLDANNNLVMTLTVRRLMSYAELNSFKAKSREFVRYIFDPKDAKPPAWKDFLPSTRDEAVAAFTLHFYATDPTPLSQLDALRIVKRCTPWLTEMMINQINAGQVEAIDGAAAKTIESEKKGSKRTSGTAPN